MGHGTIGSHQIARTVGTGMVALSLVLPTSVALTGCAWLMPRPTDTETGTGTDKPSDKAQTISSLAMENEQVFEELDAGINDGTSLPTMMKFDISYGWGMEAVDDPEAIVRIWNQLKGVEVGGVDEDAPEIEDGGFQFTFVWDDGTEVRYLFRTSEWFVDADHGVHPVIDSSVVSDAMLEARQHKRPIDDIEAERDGKSTTTGNTKNGTKGETGTKGASKGGTTVSDIPYGDGWEYEGKGLMELTAGTNGRYPWDLDGDGEIEPILFDFMDQSGNTKSAFKVVADSQGKTYAWVGGAYSVTRVLGGTDAAGQFVIVEYDQGEDKLGRSLIRLVDGELRVTDLNEAVG